MDTADSSVSDCCAEAEYWMNARNRRERIKVRINGRIKTEFSNVGGRGCEGQFLSTPTVGLSKVILIKKLG